MDGKLPEISVLDSKCLMAEEFGTLFTRARILTSGNGYAVRALDLGLNPEASRAFGDLRDTPLFRVSIGPGSGTGLLKPSQVMVDKSMTVARDKLGATFGRADDATLLEVERCLAVFLGIAS